MTDPTEGTLKQAHLEWDDQGQPRSPEFDDVYFSRHNGLEESRYVFLNHNHLAERWAALREGDVFTVAETGFGTGLNFLAAWQLWEQAAAPTARLQVISVEKHPLSRADLAQSLALWPELVGYANALVRVYPLATPGFHRLHFAGGRVSLTLLMGDAADSFAELEAQVDAWFLDGFAPAKNPQMWTPALFSQIARLSAPNATFATFTAAGLVRRGLQTQGFRVEKVSGFGRKREMLRGRVTSTPPATPAAHKPWFKPVTAATDRRVTVIGAGLAGCSTAYALAQRGWQVILTDQGDSLASEASGNPQGALYLKLPPRPTTASRIHLSGYLFTLRLLDQLLGHERGRSWDDCGVLQLAYDKQEQQRQQKLITAGCYPPALVRPVSRDEAQTLSQVPIESGGLLFPGGAWVSPAAFCRALASHPGIDLRLGTQIDELDYQPTQRTWTLKAMNQATWSSEQVVLANAAASRQFKPASHLPLKAIRGQIGYRQLEQETHPLKLVLCAQGYITPPLAGTYCFGASFNLHDATKELRQTDHQHNLSQLHAVHPRLLAKGQDPQGAYGRVGFRCATPDYLPAVGPLPDQSAYLTAYAELRHNAKATPSTPACYWPGLWANLGHGSKGLVTAPLGGELLAAQINGEPWPLEISLAEALHPARFVIKNLMRRAI